MRLQTRMPAPLPTGPMTLADYYDRLDGFDWYYAYSDDGGVYRAGERAMKALKIVAEQSPEHKALYDGFSAHYFSGKPWGTEKAPKPERPK